jgi:hypothetical protein
MWDSADWRSVVYVSDRTGAGLRRRERCLKLAGISYSVLAERRPSGTYYKLCVREEEAVSAHLALQMGGCCRSMRLRPSSGGVVTALTDLGESVWDHIALLLSGLVDLLRARTPRLLADMRAGVWGPWRAEDRTVRRTRARGPVQGRATGT